MKIIRYSIVLFIFLVYCGNHIAAQKKINGFYLNGKGGIYDFGKSESGILLNSEAGIYIDNLILGASYSKGNEISLFSNKVPLEFYSFDLLFGQYVEKNIFRAQYKIGAGLLWEEGVKLPSVGVPLIFGLKILPIAYMSLGLNFQVYLNEISYFAPLVTLEIGKLK